VRATNVALLSGAISLIASCGPPAHGELPRPSGSSLAGPAEAHVGALPAPGPDRVPLGAVSPVALEASLAPISGSARALAYVDHAGAQALVARVIGPDGPTGRPFVIPRAHLYAAFESPEGALTLATVEGGRPCLRALDADLVGPPTCIDAAPDALVSVGATLLALELRPPEPPEEPEAQKDKAKPAAKPQAKPAPKKGGDKKKPKKKPPMTQKKALERLMASGAEVELWTAPVTRSDGLGEATSSGLVFRQAMAGLGFIGAAARGERVDVVFYERADPKGKQPRGKIGVAGLDALGQHDPATRRSFGESKLEPGFLADHVDLRLVATGDGAVLLGQRGPRGKCDVTVIAPFIMQMIPEANDCALDPGRFVTLARAKHKGEVPALEPASTLDRARARRVFGQASWDVARSTLTKARAWTFDGATLVSLRGAPEPKKHTHPLEVSRLRIVWGALAPDGSGLAQLEDGLAIIDSTGRVSSREGPPARRLSGPDQPDAASASRTPAVKVGSTWWQARGELAALFPSRGAPLRALPHDTAVAVGGAASGLVLELAPPMLHVDRLEASGAPKPLGARAVPIAPGFDAIQRGAGGAIVVGARADDRSRLVSFVVAADGAMSTPRDVPLFEGAATQVSRVRLVPLPAGGALLFDVGRTRVAWLDDDGALVKAASLPAAVPPAAPCVDGHPAPAKIPSLTPGELLDFPSRTEGTCLSSELVHAADGSVRWLGSTTDGASSRAELGLVKAASSGLPPTKPPAAPALQALAPGAARRCPTEMVLVGDDLCVDRYEGALLDLGAGHYLSPDYPATPNLMAAALGDWATRRELQGDLLARALPLPSLSQWQRAATLTVAADSRAGVRPSAYVTGSTAKLACEAAGKRLCTHLEWKRACRGQADTMFPYGSAYEDGTCNVNVLVHPAAILHGNASVGHMDPRLNRVAGPRGGSVLHLTGDNPRCASRWGDDAIFDMVGNLDEWVDEKGGAFAGGFYARGTTSGCESLITAHPPAYLDYSTGVRCCKDPAP
jgi:hypothetical protein